MQFKVSKYNVLLLLLTQKSKLIMAMVVYTHLNLFPTYQFNNYVGCFFFYGFVFHEVKKGLKIRYTNKINILDLKRPNASGVFPFQ